jgi:mRNA interferase HicA
MKRIDLIRKLDVCWSVMVEITRNSKTGVSQPVPRHREVNEFLAKHILKKLAN